MNKFVELSLELNFHANWHLSLLVKFAFDSIYLCILMSAFWISFGMLPISIACNRTLSDPFRELGWLVEFWVAGVGEVSMFFLRLLEAAIIMPMIRNTLTSNNANHFCGFLNFKRDGDFCLSRRWSPCIQQYTPCSGKSLLCEIAGHSRIIIESIRFSQGPQF